MSDKKILSVDEMLAAEDVQYANVEVLGGIVRLGSIDAGEMIDFLELNQGVEKKNAAIRLIVRSLVDENGNRIGTDAHIEAWKKKSSKTVSALVDAVTKLNGVDKKDAEALADAKNV